MSVMDKENIHRVEAKTATLKLFKTCLNTKIKTTILNYL